VATSEKKNVFRRRKNRVLPLRCGSPNAVPEVVHRPRSQSPLLGTYSKFAHKINFLALGVSCPAGQSAFRRSRLQLKLGVNRIFKIGRRLIAQNSQIPNPTLIKCYPRTPHLATQLFTAKIWKFPTSQRHSLRGLKVNLATCTDCASSLQEPYTWHLPWSTTSAFFILPKEQAGKESTLPMAGQT